MEQQHRANVIDFAAYRQAHPRASQPALPVGVAQPRRITTREAAHRERMLRHLHELKALRPTTIAETAIVSGN
jgi:hypothetical protein